jgi:hypothetical protein
MTEINEIYFRILHGFKEKINYFILLFLSLQKNTFLFFFYSKTLIKHNLFFSFSFFLIQEYKHHQCCNIIMRNVLFVCNQLIFLYICI